MADTIDQVAERLKHSITSRATQLADAVDSETTGIVTRALSNTLLLLGALATFYRDSKSEYFPTVITTTVRDRLIQLDATLTGLPESAPPESVSSLVKQLEELYIYCLQYGLVTYGFNGKVAQEEVDAIRRTRRQIDDAARKVAGAVERHEVEFTRKLDALAKSFDQAESSLKTNVAGRLDALQPLIEAVAALLAAAQTDSTTLKSVAAAAAEHAKAVAQVRTDLDTAYSQATADLTSKKATAEGELSKIQAVLNQVQGFESDAKAKLQGVTDARAKITDQMNKITEFYGDIERHLAQMTDARKEAQSQLAGLRESSEVSVADFCKRTEEVVQTNESLIEQIKGHLQKAIGASLFTAFDTRRRHLTSAGRVWGGLLFLSVSGTIAFAVWFVSHLAELANSQIHPALVYARLIIAAPITFLVVFTAKQYARERRAEEEYAFKSAISVSLEPYRDLISRMTKDDHGSTALVERLVLEIFDNPAKRLYSKASAADQADEDGPMGLVSKLVDKFPKAD